MSDIEQRYLAGESISGLARDTGIAYSTLHHRLSKIGAPLRKRGQHEPESETERFERLMIPEPNSGCWLWLGQTYSDYGYGQMYLRGKKITAQRAAWILYRGAIPAGLEIDHKCRNPACVNPDHLRPITKAENLAGRELKQEFCRRGHRLAGDNLMYERGGQVRRCKTCRQARRVKL